MPINNGEMLLRGQVAGGEVCLTVRYDNSVPVDPPAQALVDRDGPCLRLEATAPGRVALVLGVSPAVEEVAAFGGPGALTLTAADLAALEVATREDARRLGWRVS